MADPAAVTYLPTGHTEHVDEPAAEAKRPELHEEQALAPAAEYVPEAHASVHAAVLAVALL